MPENQNIRSLCFTSLGCFRKFQIRSLAIRLPFPLETLGTRIIYVCIFYIARVIRGFARSEGFYSSATIIHIFSACASAMNVKSRFRSKGLLKTPQQCVLPCSACALAIIIRLVFN